MTLFPSFHTPVGKVAICLAAMITFLMPAETAFAQIAVITWKTGDDRSFPGCYYSYDPMYHNPLLEDSEEYFLPHFTIIYPRGHPKCNFNGADPHLRTFDGLRYDLQAAGEFIGVRALDDDLEVQHRLEPWGTHTTISVNTAVAARVAGHRVMFSIDSTAPVLVDDAPADFAEGDVYFLPEAQGAAVVRSGEARYSVVWPDGSNLHVHLLGDYLDTYFLAAPERDDRLVGLFGNANDDVADDFRTRDGAQLPTLPEFEELYGVFAESWRVRPIESLFTYGPGESTATFTDRKIPQAPASIADLAPDIRRNAEATCREEGVTDPYFLGNCIFDLGHTGDRRFINSGLAGMGLPTNDYPAPEPEPVDIALTAPQNVTRGMTFDISWNEARDPDDYIALVPADADAETFGDYVSVGTANSTILTAPGEPGLYELRYIAEETGEIVSRAPIEITDVDITLDAPENALVGSDVTIGWSARANERDYVTIVPPDAAEGIYVNYVEVGRNLEGQISAPAEPGRYEVRYILRKDGKTLAFRPIEIREPDLSLVAPASARAGETIEIDWTGTAPNESDYITVVPAAAPEGSYAQLFEIGSGKPNSLPAPKEAGAYEVRYILRQGTRTLTRTPVEVLPADATIK